MPRLFICILTIISLLNPLRAQSLARPAPTLITASDLFNIKQIESPALSPDGRWVAYIVRSIEPLPESKDDGAYRTQLWLAAVDGTSQPRPLTFGSATHAQLTWSPQGNQLAFVRSVEKEKPQIYLLSLAGGEAQPLTKIPTGAGNPQWSPDGTRILFTSTLSYAQLRAAREKAGLASAPAWSNEKPARAPNDTANWALKASSSHKSSPSNAAPSTIGEKATPLPLAQPDGSPSETREWLAQNEAEANPRVTDRLNFLAEGDLATEPNFNQFYVIAAQAGAEPTTISTGFANLSRAAWLADGKYLVCTGRSNLTEHPDRSRLTNLYRVELATGLIEKLQGELGCNYGTPTVSPNGQWIAFTVTTDGEFGFEQPMVAVIPSGGGRARILTAQLDRPANNLQWAKDSSMIYFTAASHGHIPLHHVTILSGAIKTLTTQAEWGINDFSVSPNGLVQIITHPGNPWEMYTSALDGQNVRPLTTHNSSWLQHRKLSTYEPHRFINQAGLAIDYWTIKPTDFNPQKKYPLLVEIHGGPSAMWGPGEASTWHEMQFFAARGYSIVFSNPRGSGGSGRDFQRANFRDWGAGPAADVLTAANFAAQDPSVDRTRQVVTGGSYGGYLTAWIVGHDHRFKAAIAARGVYDLVTFFGEGNAWSLLPQYFGGYPWEKDVRQILERESPQTYVENIKTPLLIKHADTDFRTGVIQSQMFYKSLKQMGRPVEYVRYPRSTHELSRSGEPKQRLDRLVRFEEFFRRYIGEN
ncbi:MAG: S9 family peptidase [Opitutaceae bacterium]|nr:S9 family peptidase [Opitutaceae bacterium]